MNIKRKKTVQLKKFYYITGFIIVFLATFVFWVDSLNNYDLKAIDFPAIKDKIKEEIKSINSVNKSAAEPTAVNTVDQEGGETILLKVPFTPQAPDGKWEDQRFQDGCEEASVLMAIKWVRGESLTLAEAKATILDMSDWELQSYGVFADTNAQDTADRLLRDYFSYKNYKVTSDVTTKSIVAELKLGKLVIVPANGQKLFNPHFKAPGPKEHMLVIRGYDPAKDEFITNDPGTRVGEGYRYPTAVLVEAVADYPTGNHLSTVSDKKAMIIVSK